MLSPLRLSLVRIGSLCSVGLALLALATAPVRAAAPDKQLLLIHDDARVTEPLVAFLKAKGGFAFRVKDGKIAAVREYVDTQYAKEKLFDAR